MLSVTRPFNSSPELYYKSEQKTSTVYKAVYTAMFGARKY